MSSTPHARTARRAAATRGRPAFLLAAALALLAAGAAVLPACGAEGLEPPAEAVRTGPGPERTERMERMERIERIERITPVAYVHGDAARLRAATTTTTTTAPPPPPTTAPPPPPPTTTTPPAKAVSAQSYGGNGDPSDPASWDRLAQCESGGNWAINTGNGYYGGLQFALSSWRAVGGTGYPHEHSRAEQIRRGQMLYAQGGWGHWPGCTRSFGWR